MPAGACSHLFQHSCDSSQCYQGSTWRNRHLAEPTSVPPRRRGSARSYQWPNRAPPACGDPSKTLPRWAGEKQEPALLQRSLEARTDMTPCAPSSCEQVLELLPAQNRRIRIRTEHAQRVVFNLDGVHAGRTRIAVNLTGWRRSERP